MHSYSLYVFRGKRFEPRRMLSRVFQCNLEQSMVSGQNRPMSKTNPHGRRSRLGLLHVCSLGTCSKTVLLFIDGLHGLSMYNTVVNLTLLSFDVTNFPSCIFVMRWTVLDHHILWRTIFHCCRWCRATHCVALVATPSTFRALVNRAWLSGFLPIFICTPIASHWSYVDAL